jgi:hypothetical protein
MEHRGGMMSTEKTPRFFNHSSLANLPAELFGSKQEERENGMMNLAFRSISVHNCKLFYTCCKTLRHGASLTSPPKEFVMRIFIALKNPTPSVGFEPANLE